MFRGIALFGMKEWTSEYTDDPFNLDTLRNDELCMKNYFVRKLPDFKYHVVLYMHVLLCGCGCAGTLKVCFVS